MTGVGAGQAADSSSSECPGLIDPMSLGATDGMAHRLSDRSASQHSVDHNLYHCSGQ